MLLTVLGSAASYAPAGAACSGYLVEAGGAAVLLDCGNGALANAGAVTDVTAIDAVFVSHAHVDHFADIYALQAALRYAPDGPAGRVALHLPEGLFDRMGCLLTDRGRDEFASAFSHDTLEKGRTVTVGPMAVTPFPVEHDGATFALIVESGGLRLCYTADTASGAAVADAAAGCDVLLAECTLPTAYAGRAPHMTPGDAGRLAASSGAGLLVLTHLWPTADRDELLADARSAFDGEIVIAEELMQIEIAPDHPGSRRTEGNDG